MRYIHCIQSHITYITYNHTSHTLHSITRYIHCIQSYITYIAYNHTLHTLHTILHYIPMQVIRYVANTRSLSYQQHTRLTWKSHNNCTIIRSPNSALCTKDMFIELWTKSGEWNYQHALISCFSRDITRNETAICQCVKSGFEHLEASSPALPSTTQWGSKEPLESDYKGR